MSNCLKRNSEFLQSLLSKKGNKRKRLINKASMDQIDSLSEIALNIIKGKVNISPVHKKKLNRHKEKIRKLAKKISLKARKRILVQRGGFLPLLITPILSLLGALAGKAISKAVGL